MSKLSIISLFFGLLWSTTTVHAAEFLQPLASSVLLTKTPPYLSVPLNSRKEVYLMRVKLSPEEQQSLKIPNPNAKQARPEAKLLPPRVELGMNGVPVLDQGAHGTCVTFAITAAIDSFLGKGDYLSQLCNLQLSSYLAEQSIDLPDGWDGSYAQLVLDQILSFGVIAKANEKINSCGGLRAYPARSAERGSPMSLEEFKGLREVLLHRHLSWQPLVQPGQATEETKLLEVKKFLAEVSAKKNNLNGRLTFGVLLPVSYCSAGACARHHQQEDTWALTRAISRSLESGLGGHQMIITGYDDLATAIDNEGTIHQGLLMIRNSWGDDVGDGGDYYMTYDFFKTYALSVQGLRWK